MSDGAAPDLSGLEEVVLASSNAGKLVEFRAILKTFPAASPRGKMPPLRLRALGEFPPVEFPDEGGDYLANAVAKAQAAATQLGLAAIADDSGLEVEGLDGAPGAYSARYGGPGLSDRARAAHLLAQMNGLRGIARRARFVCTSALAWPNGETLTAHGECRGVILGGPRGDGGFGYDPVFQPDGYDLAMAELPEQLKNRISHRARALTALFTV